MDQTSRKAILRISTREGRIGLGNEFYKLQPTQFHSYLSLFIMCQLQYNLIIVSLITNREKLNFGEFRNSNKDITTIYLSQKMKDPLWNNTSFFFFFFLFSFFLFFYERKSSNVEYRFI